MGNRNKQPRVTHPLIVAAYALIRATDPHKPSRLTVLRLLGDALHALQESHMRLTAIKARLDVHLSKSTQPQQPTSRHQIEADARFRQTHNEGARALFSVTVTALVKLPSRGGPLRRRAIDLLKLAALATGPASAMSAVDRIRSHLSSIKRTSWSETDVSDFEIAATLLTLAEVSTCSISSRDVAKESIHFLIGQTRVQQKCRRGDLCHALAIILASFPQHAPPDDRLIDLVLSYTLTPTALKQGLSMFGGPLLVAVIAPFVVSRGPAAGDDIALSCARTLKIAPTPTERAMWSIALARAVVTARRSSTYQLRKYGTSEPGSKFPKGQLVNSKDSSDNTKTTSPPLPPENDTSVWISNEIFEESLVKVANMTGLEEGSVDASIAIASVLRMWLLAFPSSLNVIVPRALVRLTEHLSSISSLSIVVDAVSLGILKYLKPSQSTVIFESVMPLISESGLTFPAALSICASLLGKFGRQALSESGLSTEYNTNTSLLIERIHDALESVVSAVRTCGLQAMSSVLHALPRSCSQFLTAVLQNLRISDLNIITKPVQTVGNSTSSSSINTTNGLNYYERELAPLLGNGAALSMLVEKLSSPIFSVPALLSRQCIVDTLALLKPHPATEDFNSHSPTVACVRRRVGWGIITAFARGKRKDIFEGDTLRSLLNFWTEELKYGGSTKLSKPLSSFSSSTSSSSFVSHSNQSSQALTNDNIDLQMNIVIDEALARSSARGAALCALSNALECAPLLKLKQCARALAAASAARIVSLLSNINSSSSSASTNGTFMGFGTEHSFAADSSQNKKKAVPLIQSLAIESLQLVRVAGQVPPPGDAGELCFLVAVALAEEAQRALGEVDAGHIINGHLTHGVSPSSRASHYDGVFSNRMESMLLFERYGTVESRHSSQYNLNREKKSMSNTNSDSNAEYDMDAPWLFSKDGLEAPIAERVMICSGQAIAAIIAEDLSAHGSLIESLPAAKLSPPMCATISLEMTKRLSRSDLAEINRALAVLQVLVRRSLGITGSVHHSITSQKKNGRLYTPSTTGDSGNRNALDVPGIFLQKMSHSDGALGWSREFSEESHLAHLPFNNYHSRALGMMYATRSLASEAIRELSITGGPTLWIGLTKKVIEMVRDNIEGATPNQYVVLSNALSTLGSLLEVIPEHPSSSGSGKQAFTAQTGQSNNTPDQASTINDICTQAINIITEALEVGKSNIQAAAALALSNRSYLVASSSEKLIGAFLRGWANDKGEISSLGHLGRYVEEVNLWTLCFSRVWSDMGVKEPDGAARFVTQDSNGFGSVCDSLATSAGCVLEACRMYWWPVKESSLYAVREFATDLVQWEGNCSHNSRTAGLNSLISIWSGKIDLAQAERSSNLVKEQSEDKLESEESDQPILPVESFSLKDPARVTSPVGPFLDEVIYSSLAPGENEIASRELSIAATAAVSELIRGLGVVKTCENLPRLPETLFVAIEDKIGGSQKVMNVLVNGDAEKRPRYWFGLCRAVALSNDRLNYGKKGTTWDTTYRTKAYSTRVAVDAIDCSMAGCQCQGRDTNSSKSIGNTRHSCAFGFLRKIFDFVKQISSAASFDYETCGHGCRLLQRIASRVGSVGKSFVMRDSTLNDFFEMWDPCVAMMHTLLVDRVPNGVLSSAATTVSELLVSCLKLRAVDRGVAAQRCAGTVSSYIQALIESDLRQRLRYVDQGEEIGMRAMLGLAAKYGRIISSLKIDHIKQEKTVSSQLPGAETAKLIFYALCGDFVGMLNDDGLDLISENGGAFTLAHIDKEELWNAMSAHIGPIVLGAISCIDGVQNVNTSSDSIQAITWENKESTGMKMAENNSKYEDVTLGTLVWLVTHDHSDDLSKFKRQSFCCQAQETMEYLFRVPLDAQMQKLRKEMLFCFASSNKSEGLKFAERMSRYDDIDDGTIAILVQVTLCLLLVALQDEFGTFLENEAISLCRGLYALTNIVLKNLNHDMNEHALNILDVVFQMAGHDSIVVASILAEEKVLIALCETVRACIDVLQDKKDLMNVCEDKVWMIFENGLNLNCYAMFKVSACLAAIISDRDGEIMSDLLYDMITFSDEKNQTNLLQVVLSCYGVEDCMISYINDMAASRRDDAFRIMTALGSVAASSYPYSVATAFRLSVASVLADGPYCVIVNKMGMTLYSVFLSALIHSLPSSPVGANQLSAVSKESATYFMELVEEEADMPGSFISSLGAPEREKAERFLSVWGSQEET